MRNSEFIYREDDGISEELREKDVYKRQEQRYEHNKQKVKRNKTL